MQKRVGTAHCYRPCSRRPWNLLAVSFAKWRRHTHAKTHDAALLLAGWQGPRPCTGQATIGVAPRALRLANTIPAISPVCMLCRCNLFAADATYLHSMQSNLFAQPIYLHRRGTGAASKTIHKSTHHAQEHTPTPPPARLVPRGHTRGADVWLETSGCGGGTTSWYQMLGTGARATSAGVYSVSRNGSGMGHT